MIKLYINKNHFGSFLNYVPIVAKFSFTGDDDIEIVLRLKDIKMTMQTNNVIIRRKKWFERLAFWSKSNYKEGGTYNERRRN